MASKVARQKARALHQRNKRRARMKRLFDKYRPEKPLDKEYTITPKKPFETYEVMVKEILSLNVKYLQLLLTDLKSQGAVHPWTGDYHRNLINSIEHGILEKTILK